MTQTTPDSPIPGVWRALPASLASVREARALVRTALRGWQVEEGADDLELVASELVSNALRHALGVGAGSSPSPGGDSVVFGLVRTPGHVICTVADPSHRPPVRQAADPMSGCGQGLALVESLSTCWGWDELDDTGKSVWAIVPLGLPGQAAWAAIGAA